MWLTFQMGVEEKVKKQRAGPKWGCSRKPGLIYTCYPGVEVEEQEEEAWTLSHISCLKIISVAFL
jgi:hypothetical protein